jgi:uncharacterized protein
VNAKIDDTVLQQMVQRIVAEIKPSRVILFGSYAREEADSGSDMDLMVVKSHVSDRYAETLNVHRIVGDIGLGIDVLVYSDAEFNCRSRVPGTLLYWAARKGKVLYGRAS